jgi:glucose/arabinose dehydrogenase
MKTTICFGTALLASVLTMQAQRGLKDIPNPDPKVQEAGFKLPEGAKINLFASDPLITKPIHMNWDGEGRLWVVGSPLYPHIKPGEEELDMLYILEDTNGDGTADKVIEFADNLHIPTAVLPGDGGVYVANSTEMIFIRDTDGDVMNGGWCFQDSERKTLTTSCTPSVGGRPVIFG